MEKEQPITIDAETVRRVALNAEMNPRQTIYGKATQTTNPITGRPYETDFIPQSELRRIKKDYSLKERNSNMYIKSLFSLLPKPNQIIELQKALGRMEVREGKLPELFYAQFLDDIYKLDNLYAQNPDLTLESITDVNGLNTALRAIRRARFFIEIERNTLKDNCYTENFRNATPVKEFDFFSDLSKTKRKPENRPN